MKPYYYIKAQPKNAVKPGKKLKLKKNVVFKFFSLVSFSAGCLSLGLVAWPILSYQLKQSLVTPSKKIVSPLPEIAILEAKGILSPIQTANAVDEGMVKGVQVVEERDLTIASNWFKNEEYKTSESIQTSHYLLSIPKLKIDKATVTIGGESLEESLIHYPGTALPGQLGNSVVLGHSVLPAFYNPKDYKSIFSKIPDLESGDEIYVYFDGITYIYVVHDYYEREPEEVQLMEQKFDRYEMSLVTCVPQGTYLRRGIVRAYLKKQ